MQIWTLKADHEHKADWLDVPGHHGANNPCPSCPCDTSATSRSWTAVPPHNTWKRFASMAEWYEWCKVVVVSDKVGKPPIAWFMKWADGGLGLSIFMLFQDTLHALDLGVTGHVIANVLTYMVESDLMGEGGNKEQKVKTLWREIQAEYKEQDIANQIGNLTMSMFCAKPMSDYPELTTHIKGAQARSLVAPVCAVFGMRGRFIPGKADYTPMDHEVWLVIKSLATFYEVLMTNMRNDKWRYNTHDIKVVEDSVTTMMVIYKRLSLRHMFGEGPAWVATVGPRWKWASKHHHVLHIPDEAMLQCIHLAWCYMCEGFVGTMKKVGESCRYAYKAAHRSVAICRKWAMGTCIMLGVVSQDDASQDLAYPVGPEHADDADTMAEELFGMGS